MNLTAQSTKREILLAIRASRFLLVVQGGDEINDIRCENFDEVDLTLMVYNTLHKLNDCKVLCVA